MTLTASAPTHYTLSSDFKQNVNTENDFFSSLETEVKCKEKPVRDRKGAMDVNK